MKEESEQKSLPASHKKLRDARRKGQVSHSRDLVSGFMLLVMVGYLLLVWPQLSDRVQQLVDVISQSVDRPFEQTWSPAVALAVNVLVLASLPAICIIVVTGLASGMVATLGPVFSFEPIKPKFDNINPVGGLKRIASLRNIVEFAKAAVKVVILTTAFWLVLRGAIQPLFEMPVCGSACLATMTVATVKPLAATAALAFVVIGVLDLLVQRRLFLRDMRMTRTEAKREHKDLEGDPLIRGERRRLRRALAANRGGRAGLQRAVIMVMHGEQIVGLRYRPGDTSVPIVVSKGRGEAGVQMLAEAQRLGLPVVDDAQLVAALAKRHAVGDPIVQELFGQVAKILVAAGFS